MLNPKDNIYFRHARKVIVPVSDTIVDPVTPQLLATFFKNVENYGYTFSEEVYNEITRSMDKGTFIRFAKNFTEMLRKELGAHVPHNPMYPNFPQQVMEASEVELYINAILHYWGAGLGVRIMPEYEKEEREALTDFKKLETINLGNETDFRTIFTNLVGSKKALSETNREDVKWFVHNINSVSLTKYMPDEFSNKENLATLASVTYTESPDVFETLVGSLKTVTDILRVIVGISGGDVSLAEKVRFGKFSKHVRRVFLNQINVLANRNVDLVMDDLIRNRSLWKTLGEILHPGEYAKRYPEAAFVFKAIRSTDKFMTFNGRVEEAILYQNIDTAVDLLSRRPGEFARRLDHLLRLNVNNNLVIEKFNDVADKVSTTVLWQVITHFRNRNRDVSKVSYRAFFPKGNIAKVHGEVNTLPLIDETDCLRIVGICQDAIETHYESKSRLGKVYVDPDLKRFLVPDATRSASKALNVVGRGTRVPLDKNVDTARFFIWWKDGQGRTDLDLSALLLDEEYNVISELTYYNLRDFGGVHSGDITSAPNGASEYIDVNLNKLYKGNVRYVMMIVNSYTGQSFDVLPECFAGVMGRKKAQSGEVYEPRTVSNIFDLTADTRISVPLIIDVENLEFIWTDLALKNNPQYVNNVRGNINSLKLIADTVINMHRPSLYELFAAHAEARGWEVTTQEEADVSFVVDEHGHPNVSMTEILAEYL
jgi:stress response protein SCP2